MELDRNKFKAIILTVVAILIILLLFLIFAVFVITNSNNQNKDVNILIGYDSIKQIVEHYNCKYKDDTYSEKREYPVEVNLVFKYDLYEDGESQEEFFNKIIKDIVAFVNYQNVKLIDTTRNITIEIVCKNNKIDKIIINSIEDYFIYMDSKMSLAEYEKINTISLIPDDIYLIELINNNWTSNTNFGTRESIFKNYNICFDEGIEYRKIGTTIFNVIYTKKHEGAVVNGLSVGTDLSLIEDYLGKPSFKNEKLKILGYKGGNIYAFFTEDEISIYRCAEYNYDDFWKLCDKFLAEELDFKEFMNELTYLWSDYSEYTYNTDYMFISYPNKGVDIKLNYEEESGIILYNNVTDEISKIKKYLNNTEFIAKLKIDDVFETEKRRVTNKNNVETTCKKFKKELEEQYKDDNQALLSKYNSYFDYYMEKDNLGNVITTYFVSKDNNYPKRELNEPIDTYLWANDEILIYSIYGKGIYIYNVMTGYKTTLTEENGDTYEINSYQDGILTYDKTNQIYVQI